MSQITLKSRHCLTPLSPFSLLATNHQHAVKNFQKIRLSLQLAPIKSTIRTRSRKLVEGESVNLSYEASAFSYTHSHTHTLFSESQRLSQSPEHLTHGHRDSAFAMADSSPESPEFNFLPEIRTSSAVPPDLFLSADRPFTVDGPEDRSIFGSPCPRRCHPRGLPEGPGGVSGERGTRATGRVGRFANSSADRRLRTEFRGAFWRCCRIDSSEFVR